MAASEEACDPKVLALRVAAADGENSAVTELLGEGVNPKDLPSGHSWTLLSLAAHGGHVEVLQQLAGKRGCPRVDETDPNGFQALMWAAGSGSKDACQILLEQKADVNASNASGETPLMIAAAAGNLNIVQLLLGAGADANLADLNGMAAVHKAMCWDRATVLAEILEKVENTPVLIKHLMTYAKLFDHGSCREVLQGKCHLIEATQGN